MLWQAAYAEARETLSRWLQWLLRFLGDYNLTALFELVDHHVNGTTHCSVRPQTKGFQVPATCLERRQHLLVRARQQPYTLSNLDFIAQSLALSAKKMIRPSPPVPESAASWWSSLR